MRHDGIQLLLIGCVIGCIIQILSTAEKKGDGKAERPPPRKAIVITAIAAATAITLWVIVK